jgi:hypothetical protein
MIAHRLPTLLAASSDDASPLLMVIVLMVLAAIVVAVVIACIVIAIAAAIIAMLILLGIVSTSVFIGVKDRRVTTGARWLVVQLTCLVGMIVGSAIFCVAGFVFAPDWRTRSIIFCGLLGGSMVAVAVAWLVNRLWRYAETAIAARESAQRPVS